MVQRIIHLFACRKKRRFQSLSLTTILENEYHIKTEDILPKMLDSCKNTRGEWGAYLPLEYFDDECFDCRTPEDWLSLGLDDGVRKPVPALCLLPESDDQHHCKFPIGRRQVVSCATDIARKFWSCSDIFALLLKWCRLLGFICVDFLVLLQIKIN